MCTVLHNTISLIQNTISLIQNKSTTIYISNINLATKCPHKNPLKPVYTLTQYTVHTQYI